MNWQYRCVRQPSCVTCTNRSNKRPHVVPNVNVTKSDLKRSRIQLRIYVLRFRFLFFIVHNTLSTISYFQFNVLINHLNDSWQIFRTCRRYVCDSSINNNNIFVHWHRQSALLRCVFASLFFFSFQVIAKC